MSTADYVPALGFRRLTPYYDAVVGVTTREQVFKRALIAQADIAPGHQVLDLACGTGTLAIWLKQGEPSARVTGVDGDPAMLALATTKAAAAGVSITFEPALANALPFASATFDRALSSLFFHHLTLEQKRLAALELFRVLKPGAELHVADWGVPTGRAMRALFLSIQLLDGFSNTNDNVKGRLVSVFEHAGFEFVRHRRVFNTIFGTMALYSAVKVA